MSKTGKSMHDNPKQAVLYSYLAGIIDGEGTFRINRCTSPKSMEQRKMRSPIISPQICIGMVDKAIPDLLCETTGKSRVREERVPNRRSIWRWAMGGRQDIMKFIPEILPYLIVKKPQAILMMEFCKGWKIPFARGVGLSDEELQWREEMYWKMRKLNAVGAAATKQAV
jgi:hypothetical protein